MGGSGQSTFLICIWLAEVRLLEKLLTLDVFSSSWRFAVFQACGFRVVPVVVDSPVCCLCRVCRTVRNSKFSERSSEVSGRGDPYGTAWFDLTFALSFQYRNCCSLRALARPSLVMSQHCSSQNASTEETTCACAAESSELTGLSSDVAGRSAANVSPILSWRSRSSSLKMKPTIPVETALLSSM